ncbi:MAG: tetraacyldisaccharide 4'-kinase [Bdellovibrionota bacterium]
MIRHGLSGIYAGISTAFHSLYDREILKSYTPSKPTIVVGNLSYGGTGKTPVTKELIRYFLSKGLKVAVISRSYKGEIKNPTLVDVTKLDASRWGDEAFMIAKEFPKISVVVGARKVDCVKWAEANLSCDVIIVDDGLQHRALKGHFYLVLLDISKPIKDYRWAPLGTLRESHLGLERADALVLTKINWADPETRWWISNHRGNLLAYELRYLPGEIVTLDGQSSEETFSDKGVLVSGIGSPESFKKLVTSVVKHNTLSEVTFPDHHIYNKQEISQLEETAKQINALIFTTSKDAVKIKPLASDLSLWREVKLQTQLQGKEKLHAQLDEVLRKFNL